MTKAILGGRLVKSIETEMGDSTVPKPVVAAAAIASWGGDVESVRHVGGWPSLVFKATIGGRDHALRLTQPMFRSRSQIEAECAFVEHLAHGGVPVAVPIRSISGAWVEDVPSDDRVLHASVNSWASGIHVNEQSESWNECFVRAWGQSLGAIHAASVLFQPHPTIRRFHWREDVWLANAEALFEPGDREVRYLFAIVLDALASLPERPETFGLIHGDHWPENFRYDPVNGITHFDFENCRYHWFLADAIASLGMLRRLDGGRAGTQCNWFLEAYQERFSIDSDVWDHRLLLLRLQRFYAYLSRLHLFGKPRTVHEERTLAEIRLKVLQQDQW